MSDCCSAGVSGYVYPCFYSTYTAMQRFLAPSHMTPQFRLISSSNLSINQSSYKIQNITHHTSHTSTLISSQSGQLHAMQGDWSRAVTSYRRSLDGFEAACGKKDKRITEVMRLLQVTINIYSIL